MKIKEVMNSIKLKLIALVSRDVSIKSVNRNGHWQTRCWFLEKKKRKNCYNWRWRNMHDNNNRQYCSCYLANICLMIAILTWWYLRIYNFIWNFFFPPFKLLLFISVSSIYLFVCFIWCVFALIFIQSHGYCGEKNICKIIWKIVTFFRIHAHAICWWSHIILSTWLFSLHFSHDNFSPLTILIYHFMLICSCVCKCWLQMNTWNKTKKQMEREVDLDNGKQ